MTSNYQKQLNAQLKVLIANLIRSYLHIEQKESLLTKNVTNILSYLNSHSTDYVPRKNDVEKKFEGLTEKLEINCQMDKSNLLYAYLNRLKYLYEKKSPEEKDNLYSSIYLILELAHSPLNSIVNLDMMKEKFETRCLKNKYSYYFKIKYKKKD